jgi:cellulose synthase/poly-beta-1,6-N-acetylglucosamine synthase-like glycosyltransferase
LFLLYSYLFYPWLLKRLSKNKRNNTLVFTETDELPDVSVIMSVYNEEKVIQGKIHSLMKQDYPQEKLRIFVGSDCSTDRTDELLTAAAMWVGLLFMPFKKRRGKPGVINELIGIALQQWPVRPDHILLITDANVILAPQTLRHLVKHFRNDKIAIVDAHMVHTGMRPDDISQAESTYISSEVLLKHREGIVWGKMIGPFGGCYALRTPYFSKVPPKFLVDDFYIAMRAFEKGGDAISELDAVCYEAVSHEIMEEYRRKSRISAGNFQNLLTFRHLWWPPFQPLPFAFFSHKVLRWLGPFFLISILISGVVLAWSGNLFYRILLLCILLGIVVFPALDFLLKILKINILPLRGLRYFLIMNMALLEGFVEFVKGIKTNVWEPPKRH